jgi:hypothetical protein
MTFRELVGAVLRWWYVPLVLLLAAGGFAFYLERDGGLYVTRTVVMFIHLEPSQVAIGPDNGTANDNIIAFAGAVASDVNNGRPVTRYARVDAPFYGAGTTEGVHVSLPDDGGQWTTTFTRAELDIEIVGRSREHVDLMQRTMLLKVFDRARELQGPAYNNPDERIRTQVVPLSLTIDHITASRREQVVAVVSLELAASIVGVWCAVRLESVLGSSERGRTNMPRNKPDQATAT